MEHILPGLWGAPHLHPVLVHFPIALWSTVPVLWLAALVFKRDDAWRFGLWLLALGTVSGLIALGAGFLAAEQMGHDSPGHDMVHTHRDFMVVTTVMATALTVAAVLLREREGLRLRVGLLVGMLATVVALVLGADRGALMVFKYSIGTAGEPIPGAQEHDHGGADHGGSTPGDDTSGDHHEPRHGH